MDRKQREAARARKNYFKKKEEAARTKALDAFLKREAPAILARFEEEYRKGRAEESVTNPPAIPNETLWLEDGTQWMDDLPDLGPNLPELDSSLP